MSPSTMDKQSQLKRRATGFVHSSDLTLLEDDSDNDISDGEALQPKINRQQSFIPIEELVKVKLTTETDVSRDYTKYHDKDELVSYMITKR